MIRRLLALSIAATALCLGGIAVAEEAETIEKGKALYEAAKPKCTMCHTEKKNPLDNLGPPATPTTRKPGSAPPRRCSRRPARRG